MESPAEDFLNDRVRTVSRLPLPLNREDPLSGGLSGAGFSRSIPQNGVVPTLKCTPDSQPDIQLASVSNGSDQRTDHAHVPLNAAHLVMPSAIAPVKRMSRHSGLG
jgi:hypothetical protein